MLRILFTLIILLPTLNGWASPLKIDENDKENIAPSRNKRQITALSPLLESPKKSSPPLTTRISTPVKTLLESYDIAPTKVEFLNNALYQSGLELCTNPNVQKRRQAGISTPELHAFKDLNPLVIQQAHNNIVLSPSVRFLCNNRKLIALLSGSRGFGHIHPSMFKETEETETDEYKVKRCKIVEEAQKKAHDFLTKLIIAEPNCHTYEMELYIWKPFLDHFECRINHFNGIKISAREYKEIFRDMVAPLYQSFSAGKSISYYSLKVINMDDTDSFDRTNKERIKEGLSPIGPDGLPMVIHHIHFTHPGDLVFITDTLHKTYSKLFHIHKNSKLFRNAPAAVDRNDFTHHKQEDIFPAFHTQLELMESSKSPLISEAVEL
jgi:hypothetical protein